MKYLIVGLGNIGAKYELTRHNAGFLILDRLAEQKKAEFSTGRLAARAEFKSKGRTIVLLKPSTYMNLSGKAVNYWMQKLKTPVENMLIIVDDVALSFGKIRMRAKGSSAGHNGLNNIQEVLNTLNYPRLRFGIGNEYPPGHQIDYVLSNFNQEQLDNIVPLLDKAGQMILSFTAIGVQRTMNQFND